MLHQHVVVHMLASIGHEQAIDQALASLTRQYRMHIVANQRAAQQQRMGRHVGVTSLLDAQGGEVISRIAFPHDHVVRDAGIVARDEFCCGIGKRRAFAQ